MIRRSIKYAQALTEISQYLAEENPDLALKFLDELENTEILLLSHPGIGRFYDPDHPTLNKIRIYRLNKFKAY